MNFDEFKLHSTIMAGVRACGYTAPTPIQLETIPPIMQGRDVMGLAQTGTGKTAAFALPILQHLSGERSRRPRALIIAPTRELTLQTHEAVTGLGRKTRLKSTTIYGGVSMHGQINALRKGVDIISACPGRLLDHINRRTIDLSRVEILVLDEADQMFDMGFLPDVRKIIRCLPEKRQNLLFSATMPNHIASFAGEILNDPVRIQIGATAPAKTVSHTFYPVADHSKNALLKQILDSTETSSVLVFTRTKHRSKSVARQLEKSGYGAAAINGNLSQNQRQKALDGFRTGRYQILVATDIAARGIDVQRVSHVINYDLPATVDAYIHRIGRTGRMNHAGNAFSLVSSTDKGPVRAIKRTIGSGLKYCEVEGMGGEQPGVKAPAEPRKRPSAARKPYPAGKKKQVSRSRGAYFSR